MRRAALSIAVLALAACPRKTVESGLRVDVTFERGTVSKCVQLTARGGSITRSTEKMTIGGKEQLQVGIAQGDFPDRISVEAVGYSGADCATETDPPERALPTDFTFVLNKTTTVGLTLVHTGSETDCTDGRDNDGDGDTDCVDSDCDGKSCSTGNACVEGQVCANHSCSNGSQVTCDRPPSVCFQTQGLCVQGADGGCRYTAQPGLGCNDQNRCTDPDTCGPTGECRGQPITCAQSTNSCLEPAGTCDRDAGCQFAARANAPCDDGDNCSVVDLCDTQGRCSGTPVSCANRECATFTGQCDRDGGCRYDPFDAGIACSDGGVCNGSGFCIAPFPYPPSNFTLAQVPAPPSQTVVLDCGETIIATNASGRPTVSNWCGQADFGWTELAQDGGPNAVLLSFSTLDIGADGGLRITGPRPAIIVATRNVHVFGWISAESGGQQCGAGAGRDATPNLSNGGGGGGAFGSAGADGGDGAPGPYQGLGATAGSVNGDPRLIPLRGGCPGGVGGGNSSPAIGGGGLQISAGQNISITGAIGAPGKGGAGGQSIGQGGNGAGSGGGILLEALMLDLVGYGAITANGGGGGKGAGALGAESGSNGDLRSAFPASGGTGLGVGGNGGDGGTARVAASPGAWSSLAAGGGGGGGVGRVRLNAQICSVSPLAVFSPAPASTPDSGCP